MNETRFSTRTLKENSWGPRVTRIITAALDAVDPSEAVSRNLSFAGNDLVVAGKTYHLEKIDRIILISLGKAGYPMMLSAAGVLGEYLHKAVVVVKEGHAGSDHKQSQFSYDRLEIFEAGHPLPDQHGIIATQQIKQLIQDTSPNDLVLCLISGGGSALMLSPSPGISLEDYHILTDSLLASGANIEQVNTLRKHIDDVKGGGLAQMAFPANVATLILSDVVGDQLDVIASGPTVPDTTTYQDAIDILEKFHLVDQIPQSILRHLDAGVQGKKPETPKPGDRLFQRVCNAIICSNRFAAEAALKQAQQEGMNALILSTYLQGEARQIGCVFSAIARQFDASDHPIPRPACLIAGGETTVTLRGNGLGGRNQELALSTVRELAGIKNIALVTLATDGGDGPTDAAGAIVTGETLAHASLIGLDPVQFLMDNDSYHFFEPLGDLLKPGPTLTNVNDLTFMFAF